MNTTTYRPNESVLATILSGETFWPSEPHSLEETGLTEPFVESLICKLLLSIGVCSGRKIAEEVCLPFNVIEQILSRIKSRQLVVHTSSAPFNDYHYNLTEKGQQAAQTYMELCAYVGPAPVPLIDYIISVEAQAIGDEAIRRDELEEALHDISVPTDLMDLLGPAVNSAAGMFIFGAPGNGKSTLAKRITACFGQEIWIPHCIGDGGSIIKTFDPAYHHEVRNSSNSMISTHPYDKRWRRIRRPTVVVGGELTMDGLEIRHNPRTNISEAPLQLKSNGGCLLIDDFGRQRISPEELLNRWIIPLENRHDFLSLPTGKKIQVPFEQLIIFSTNLEPDDLVDEAFLRRIPYKIEIGDPDRDEFHMLFRLAADNLGCEYNAEAVEYLLESHYQPNRRAMRRCHPRDLLSQIKNLCVYNELPFEMRSEYFDRVAGSFFATVLRQESAP